MLLTWPEVDTLKFSVTSQLGSFLYPGTLIASALYGYTPHVLKPEITLDGQTAFNQASENKVLKLNLLITFPGFFWK